MNQKTLPLNLEFDIIFNPIIKRIRLFFVAFLLSFTANAASDDITIIAGENNIEELLVIDPFNLDYLKIYYHKQYKKHDYHGAIKTLEKIIFKEKNPLPYFLELAKIQFLLHDYKNSKENFLYVYNQDVPLDVKSNIKHYLRYIEKQLPNRINYNFKLGFNENINNGTHADTIEVFGIPFKVDDESKAIESYEFFTNINTHHDFKNSDYLLRVGFDINHSNFTGSKYDRLNYGVSFGPEFFLDKQKINLKFNTIKEERGSNPLLNSQKINLSHAFNYRENIQFQSGFGTEKIKYYNNTNYNSDKKSLSFKINFLDKNNINYIANIIYSDNDAHYKPYGNEKILLSASIANTFENGLISNITFGIEEAVYDAVELIWLKKRKDQLNFLSIDLRHKKLNIGNFMPQINLTLRKNNSNLNVFDTSTNSISIYMLKDF